MKRIKLVLSTFNYEDASLALSLHDFFEFEFYEDKEHPEIIFYNLDDKDISTLKTIFGEQIIDISIDEIDSSSFENNWINFFEPININDKLLVKLSEQNCPDNINADYIINIESTRGFGTGSHATTYLCLQYLAEIFSTTTPTNMLDIGTGSGILAMYGSMSGINEIYATDIDDNAIEAANINLKTNLIENVHLSNVEIDKITGSYELITANILSGIIESNWHTIKKLATPNATLILSGILKDEVPEFIKKLDISEHEVKFKDDWAAIKITFYNI